MTARPFVSRNPWSEESGQVIGNLIAMAYRRMPELEHLQNNPLLPAIPRDYGRYRHVC